MRAKDSLLENAIQPVLLGSSSPFANDALHLAWLVLVCIGGRSIDIGRRVRVSSRVSW